MLKQSILISSLVLAGLTACNSHTNGENNSTTDHAATTHDEAKLDEHHIGTLPVEKRVAFMSGHVQAGLALYRAGAPDQAAKHLLHPVSETHQAERAGIDALGFDQEIFITVFKALDEGKPASEIEPQLAAAQANMVLMQSSAGGDPIDVINYLMDTVLEEYAIGVKNGEITDPGEYQDAFGFTVVAIGIATHMDHPQKAEVLRTLNALLDSWPETGPLATSVPTPIVEITKHVADVKSAL